MKDRQYCERCELPQGVICPHCKNILSRNGDWQLIGSIEQMPHREFPAPFAAPKPQQCKSDFLFKLCPDCNQMIVMMNDVFVGTQPFTFTQRSIEILAQSYCMVYPPHEYGQFGLPNDFDSFCPDEWRKKYTEAHMVSVVSPNAAGALLRRLLQQIIRKELGITDKSLDKEIERVKDGNLIKGYIELDQIREIGNFGAHPEKSTSPGVVVDVDFEEVEWLLENTKDLLDYLFRRKPQSEETQKKIDEKKQIGRQSK